MLCLLAPLACSAQLPKSPHGDSFVVLSPRPTHRFFDKTNLALHGWNVAAETYDAVTTRRALKGQSIHELNPFGALFVNHG
ncbi:MAG TPA: hypothetical protein VKT29_15965, partial [Terriglobales bacterium]|nr:hypothetical protein [Terriglobales bacterium]